MSQHEVALKGSRLFRDAANAWDTCRWLAEKVFWKDF